jgi:hypothetical protein
MAVTINGTSGITNPNGSAGAPSLVGQGSTTGVYFPSNTSVGLATGGLGRLIADASGYITTPYNPAFMAYIAGGNTVVGANSLIPYSAVLFDVASNFNTSTYRFTAPIAGSYVFYNQYFDNTGSGSTISAFFKNGSVNGSTKMSSTQTSANNFQVIYLNANDYVQVVNQTGTSRTFYGADGAGSSAVPHTFFCGHLIG